MRNSILKKLSLLLFLVIVFGRGNPAIARSLNRVEILKASENWIHENPKFWQLEESGTGEYSIDYKKQLIQIMGENSAQILAFVVSLKPKGFLILSRDTRLKPILGFSRESTYWPEENAKNLLPLLIRADVRLRLDFIEKGEDSTDLVNQNQKRWRELLNNQERSPNSILEKSEIYGPYLSSNWGQGRVNGEDIFNLYTPNHWSVGCVATAMAQILYYYQWPVTGTGSHLYNEDDVGSISVDFSQTHYDWKNMLPDYQ